jgi:hypothetical protein
MIVNGDFVDMRYFNSWQAVVVLKHDEKTKKLDLAQRISGLGSAPWLLLSQLRFPLFTARLAEC